MNKLLNKIIEERKGHYCHDIEVNDVFEIELIIEGVINGYGEEFTESDYIDFFQTIAVHYLGDNPEIEKAVFDFNFSDYMKGTIN